MEQLETAFAAALADVLTAAKQAGLHDGARLQSQLQKFGAVRVVKGFLKKGQLSDGFSALAAAGRLELSVEALVVSPKFSPLFSDEEVNACFALLCEAGFYR